MDADQKVLRLHHAKLKNDRGEYATFTVLATAIRGHVKASSWTELVINGGFIPVTETPAELDKLLGWSDQGGSSGT